MRPSEQAGVGERDAGDPERAVAAAERPGERAHQQRVERKEREAALAARAPVVAALGDVEVPAGVPGREGLRETRRLERHREGARPRGPEEQVGEERRCPWSARGRSGPPRARRSAAGAQALRASSRERAPPRARRQPPPSRRREPRRLRDRGAQRRRAPAAPGTASRSGARSRGRGRSRPPRGTRSDERGEAAIRASSVARAAASRARWRAGESVPSAAVRQARERPRGLGPTSARRAPRRSSGPGRSRGRARCRSPCRSRRAPRPRGPRGRRACRS